MAEKKKSVRWCDLRCEHARFPEETAVDGSKSCRTFAALYCLLLKRYVQKNTPCAALLDDKN
ncbi:hypothetical protein AMJ80_11080 [bacterium SM23_31]|nr:MAG: hypothetical protein AMJ80_11080 [bacterium SM23_31]